MKNWFSIQAKQQDGAEVAEVSIYDEIGMWGVTAKEFINGLKPHKGKPVMLSINSPGGSVFDALAIYNALRNHGAEITVRIMGVAASAASLIAMAGDKIVMPENAFLMIHNPMGTAWGANADEMRELADVLDKIGASLVRTYSARTGLSDEEVKALLDAETYLSAEEAVAQGFADELEPALRIAASFDTDRLPENVRAAFDAAAEGGQQGQDDDAAAAAVAAAAAAAAAAVAALPETLAQRIQAAADAAGLGDHVLAFLTDKDIATAEDVTQAVARAREVAALCAVAKMPEKAAALIKARASLEDARAALCDALADADEATHVDSHGKGNSKPATNAGGPAALKPADIWAARHKTVH